MITKKEKKYSEFLPKIKNNKLVIPIYWYEDEDGNKVYDVESMLQDFEDLTGQLEPSNLK